MLDFAELLPTAAREFWRWRRQQWLNRRVLDRNDMAGFIRRSWPALTEDQLSQVIVECDRLDRVSQRR